MAWEEWERLKAETATREATRIQLNQAASGGAGGDCSGPDLASSPRAKKSAAKAIQEVLVPGVVRDGKCAAESMNAAIKEFGARDGSGWDSSSALKKAQRTWEKQVKTLLDRLADEKAALIKTSIDLRGSDLDTAGRLNRASRLDDC
ncbi:hypothetical protein M4914_16150 [Streptomyces somaliensis DSM 40738]|uniref:AG1 protein n=1 Tax=Streptomyces somaliensis (strain ATCC 33201 / DSM 40738 / JCM 12659 / KCTC 9044 / NCTC 11332 / NRRL B-12077 / IP 733) TaxID=1134445 RepID=A0AA44D9D2_STRE0|nr:hypothetical protein [Streptomyces somaliensis]MCQ0024340.1 hypothetical protein [Streptomyces somaliensis DSM 40738]NKY12673.1 hypothetical protein [Streptomyces somaliensis DSM 40738]